MVCWKIGAAVRPSVGLSAVFHAGPASRDGAGFGQDIDVDDLVGERDYDRRAGVIILEYLKPLCGLCEEFISVN